MSTSGEYFSHMKKNLLRLLAISTITILSITGLVTPVSANGPGVCGPENFAGGTGALGDPYLVHNENALNELRDCGVVYKYYVQTADIELSGPWTPIPSFTGNYNGGYHDISGIEISGNGNTVGFFGNITAGYITSLEIRGSVTNTGLETGLLAGSISNGSTVTDITAYADVSGFQDTGGLIGAAYSSAVNNVMVSPLNAEGKVRVTNFTGGGVIGYVLNSDVDLVIGAIDVLGTTDASQIGGIYGAAVWTAGEYFTHSLLYAGADVTALNAGSFRCGGIAGMGDFPIELSKVIDAEITCEHLDIGGAVGYFTASLIDVKVTANIEARRINDEDDETQIGGLVGYWSVVQPQSISRSDFSGDITGENNMGGLVGVLNFSSAPDGADITIDHSYSVGRFVDSNGASGFVSTIIQSVDPLIEADFSIQESYTSMDYLEESDFNDAISASYYEIDFQNVLWNSSKENAQSQYAEVVPGVTYKTMMRPLYWANRGFDFTSEWAMNSQLNNRLPILRGFAFNGEHDVTCKPKTYASIVFAKNSYTLTKAAKKKIKEIGNKILSGNCLYVSSAGHTSAKETKSGKSKKKFQLTLSSKRANAVADFLYDYLFSKGLPAGVGREAFGAKQLLNKDKTKKHQAANRRVVISSSM